MICDCLEGGAASDISPPARVCAGASLLCLVCFLPLRVSAGGNGQPGSASRAHNEKAATRALTAPPRPPNREDRGERKLRSETPGSRREAQGSARSGAPRSARQQQRGSAARAGDDSGLGAQAPRAPPAARRPGRGPRGRRLLSGPGRGRPCERRPAVRGAPRSPEPAGTRPKLGAPRSCARARGPASPRPANSGGG